jgi:hypothetical protein
VIDIESLEIFLPISCISLGAITALLEGTDVVALAFLRNFETSKLSMLLLLYVIGFRYICIMRMG